MCGGRKLGEQGGSHILLLKPFSESPESRVDGPIGNKILALEEGRLSNATDSLGRNNSCPCGSALKFDKCHGDRSKLQVEVYI
jgi:SEC-C motif